MSSRVTIICLVSCLIFMISSWADARAVVTEHGQSSGVSEQTGLAIRQVTQAQSFDEPITFKISNTRSIFGDQWSTFRDQPPSSYIFKINSLSSLKNTGRKKFESGVFEAGGYKWRMIFYPEGDNKAGSYLYVSLYVALEDARSLSGDVYAEVELFAYNQNRKKYMMVQDAPMTRFNAMNPVGGSPKFMSQATFSGWFNEYLVNDNCILGAEIKVYDHPAKQQESLSMLKINSDEGTFTWKIKSFDANQDKYASGDFVVGGRTWQLHVYPKGVMEEKGKSLSAFLYLADYQKLRPYEEVFVRGKMRVLGQWRIVEKPFWTWLNTTITDWGRRDLLPLRNLNEYILQGSLKIQVEVQEVSQTKYLP